MAWRRRSTVFLCIATVAVALAITSGPAGPSAASGRGAGAPAAWALTPNAAPADVQALSGIACPTSTRCFAVGPTYDPSGSAAAFVETWDGTTWTAQPAPSVAGALNWIQSISCASTSMCVAVGRALMTDGHSSARVLRWDGVRWSAATLPQPLSIHDALDDVSCPTTSYCMAVGRTGNRIWRTLVALWRTGAWSYSVLPGPPGVYDESGAVSCVSAAYCVVGGTQSSIGSTVVIRVRANGVWSTATLPTIAPNTTIADVTCLTTSFCIATGNTGLPDDPPEGTPFVLQWNGTAWSSVRSPASTSALPRALGGVACTSPTSCVAGGEELALAGGGGRHALIEHWDGAEWRETVVPQSTNDGMADVACFASTGSCLAVGLFADAAAVMTGPLASPSWAVSASWDANEDARLQQIGAYLGLPPDQVQKTAVYLVAYLVGVSGAAPDPHALPPAGAASTYTSVWSPSEYAVLDAVEAHFVVDDADATRASVGVLSYLLSLGGH